jgi:hypothetical protein
MTANSTPKTPPVPAHTVISPLRSLENLCVIHDGGAGNAADPLSGWSCAMFDWEGDPVIGLRWNGGEGQPRGMPQSRGIPVWFIIPAPLAEMVRQLVVQLTGPGGSTALTRPLRTVVNDAIEAFHQASAEEVIRLQQRLR